jgi:hypothetical protein
MVGIEQLATTLQELAGPGAKRKELIAAVREKHPKASKKDIVRAAFFALTSAVDGDVERAQRLHDFALSERTSEEVEAPLPTKLRKKDRRKKARYAQQPVH